MTELEFYKTEWERATKGIAELEKENAELKAQNEILVKDLQTAIDTNRQWLKRDTALEAQIEKMKCCGTQEED